MVLDHDKILKKDINVKVYTMTSGEIIMDAARWLVAPTKIYIKVNNSQYSSIVTGISLRTNMIFNLVNTTFGMNPLIVPKS